MADETTNNLSKEELLNLYKTVPQETLEKLGIYQKAKQVHDEIEEAERLKRERLQRAEALVEEAMELLDRYRLSLRVTSRGIKFVDAEGKTVYDGSKGAKGDESTSRKRLPHGEKTPQEAYEKPILQALVQLGGSGTVDSVLSLVEEQMRAFFRPIDLEPTSPGRDLRWRNTAKWARNKLREEGLIKADSPRGIWEISEKGREYLKQEGC
ncbi:MAG: winged helix-turn-helix domain-containing protein [Candidatus Poribacteria bacterium]